MTQRDFFQAILGAQDLSWACTMIAKNANHSELAAGLAGTYLADLNKAIMNARNVAQEILTIQRKQCGTQQS